MLVNLLANSMFNVREAYESTGYADVGGFLRGFFLCAGRLRYGRRVS